MVVEGGKTKLSDIAKIVGCSVATVSNAINGRGRMSDETREEVLRLCGEMNFVPNSAGRSLRLQRTDVVGVIYSPSLAELFGNVFYARVMEGMAESLGEAGLDLMLGHRITEGELPGIVRQGKVDALVVLAGVFGPEVFETLRICPVPVCVVDGHVESLQADSLTIDGHGGGRKVAEYLVDQGHREVEMVADDSPIYNIGQRIDGFLAGLRGRGIDLPEERLVARVDNDEGAVIHVLGRLRQANPPTAIFAADDALAACLIEELTKAGVKVPEEVSVVGFGDEPLAARCDPPLTTVGMDKRGLGAISAKLVLERINRPDKEPVHHVQPTQLVIRDSVRKLQAP